MNTDTSAKKNNLAARLGQIAKDERVLRLAGPAKFLVALVVAWYCIYAGYNLARPLAWADPSYFNIEHNSDHGWWEATKLRAKAVGSHPVVVERDWLMRARAYTAIDVGDRRFYYVYIPERAQYVETLNRRW